MRSQKNFLGEIDSSFFSCEKDAEAIVRKLFVDSKPYSDELKRLLLINTKDCLDDRTNPNYIKKIRETSLSDIVDQGFLRLKPLVKLGENEEVKSYLIITFDNFSTTSNRHFRDCTVMIDIICHIDCWDIGNYRQRPLKIAGYVDGILDNARLSGIGTLEFMGCNETVLNEELAGYCLIYRAVHAEDDDELMVDRNGNLVYLEEDEEE